MPPKQSSKVQPKSAASEKRGKNGTGGGGGGKTKKITDEPLPPITTVSSADPDKPLHENDIYNQYDLDGHRVASPEPKTRFGKLLKRVKKSWRRSILYQKKKEWLQKFHDWRCCWILKILK